MQNKVKSTSLSSPLVLFLGRDADDANDVVVKIRTILHLYMECFVKDRTKGRLINRLMCFLHFCPTHLALWQHYKDKMFFHGSMVNYSFHIGTPKIMSALTGWDQAHSSWCLLRCHFPILFKRIKMCTLAAGQCSIISKSPSRDTGTVFHQQVFTALSLT